jgi:hypothetical protein
MQQQQIQFAAGYMAPGLPSSTALAQQQDPMAAFLSVPISKELAEAQSAVAAVAAALPGLTPQQIIYNAAIAMSQAMIAHASGGLSQQQGAAAQADTAAAAVLEAQLGSYVAAMQPMQLGWEAAHAAGQPDATAKGTVQDQPQVAPELPADHDEAATKGSNSSSPVAQALLPGQPVSKAGAADSASGPGSAPAISAEAPADFDVAQMLTFPAASQPPCPPPMASAAPVQ